MKTNRLEAFSDGVLAIIITIMVLELKIPHGSSPQALVPLIPVALSYLLSFVYVGIYWNNHHHMLHLFHSDRPHTLGQFAFVVLVIAYSIHNRLDGREPFYSGAGSALRAGAVHGFGCLLAVAAFDYRVAGESVCT